MYSYDDILMHTKKIVSEQLTVDETTLSKDDNFIDDLGADSLDTVELVMALEEEFGIEIPDKDAEGIHTLGEAVQHIAQAMNVKS